MEGIEGILVKDEETDIRTEMSEGESESSAKGYPDVDEEARQELRDRLRRTLRQKREMSLGKSTLVPFLYFFGYLSSLTSTRFISKGKTSRDRRVGSTLITWYFTIATFLLSLINKR